MPDALDGPETWSGWRACDFGYPLVNYVRGNGTGLECAYLTEREMGEKPGVKADIARVRMVVARDKLRNPSGVGVACGACGEPYFVEIQGLTHACPPTQRLEAVRPAGRA
jgi:hypothetical protein